MNKSVHVYSHALTKIFSDLSGNFLGILKCAYITSYLKKGDTTNKSNYRPISTLSNFSKIFEKLIYNQINYFMKAKLSKYLTSFRKIHNTEHVLLKMIETRWSMLNKSNKVGAIAMDLSKVFDTLNHNLLCKLKVYGFDTNTSIQLSSKAQRLKISLANWKKSQNQYIKVLFLIPYFLTYLLMVSFLLLKLLHFVIIQMLKPCILQTETLTPWSADSGMNF